MHAPIFTPHSYGEYILPSTIHLQMFIQITSFASEHPLLRAAAPSLLKSLDRAYARNAAGSSSSLPQRLSSSILIYTFHTFAQEISFFGVHYRLQPLMMTTGAVQPKHLRQCSVMLWRVSSLPRFCL
jgi:hypothetical protein